MNYRDLTHVKPPTGWKKPPTFSLRLYPLHVLLFSSEQEAAQFVDSGYLWRVGDNQWTYTVHVLKWLRAKVGRVNDDWEIASAREPDHVRIYFRRKVDAMLFKLTWS